MAVAANKPETLGLLLQGLRGSKFSSLGCYTWDFGFKVLGLGVLRVQSFIGLRVHGLSGLA